ncbi:hypothetical protein QBC47DRAFT_98010 [Echria macrotheca]|uniref:Uncharacterized protein n=1 Tax=Echria macrotheca TaxID=438768 RepID=A0AAJ0BIU2_9PEZI|nr:hypothetical protein QBC47DRAFT_98010 [Echria macrotheca]
MSSRRDLKITATVWLAMLLQPGHASEYDKILSAAQEAKHNLPAPTPAPLLVRDIRNRQVTSSSSTTFTVTKVSDSTCGYLSGSPGNAITCENKAPCTWEAQYISNIICGLLESDGTKLRCFNREQALDPSACNDVCQSNTYNLLCTETASPYCRTYAYPSGVRDYRCAATPVSGVQSVLHTYNGEEDRTLTTSILGGEILNAQTSRAPGATPTASSTSSLVNRTTILTVVPTQTAPPSEGSSSTPVGPIVGGVIGGVAVIALFVLGIFFLIRRKNSGASPQSAPSGPAAPYGPAGNGGYPPMQQSLPVSPATTYDPMFKGGSMSVVTSPGSVGTPEDYARMSQAYSTNLAAPPNYQMYQQGPPGVPMAVPHQTVSPDLPSVYENPSAHHVQGVHEIGTTEDQHRGRLHEVS